MDGLAGYTSSSSEDGENSQKNTSKKISGKPYISQAMNPEQMLEAKKRQRTPSPYSPTSPTKMAKTDLSSETHAAFTNSGNDTNKDENNYRSRSRSPHNALSRFFESSEIDAGLKAQLTALLGKVDELLANQEKVLKNQERLLSLLDSNVKTNVTENSKQQTVRVLTPSSSQVLNINTNAPIPLAHKQTTTESDISFTEFKVPPLPAENIPFTCINSVLTTQPLAQAQDTVLKTNSQNEETIRNTQTQQAKLFQEITIPADFQLESSGNEIEILSKDDAPFLNESDSDRMKDLLWWAQKIKSKSCSIGNFATNLVKLLFTKDELQNKNCSGTRGKSALDPDKLAFVKYCTFRLYSKYDSFEQDNIWRKKCIVSIDEYLRRGNRTRANSRTVSQEGSGEDDDKSETKEESKSASLEYSEQQETTSSEGLQHTVASLPNMIAVTNTVT